MNKKRVVVGLSGGVDSSVSAALLLEQGYEVIALFMRNWNDSSVIIDDECPWIEDSNDALLVAQQLGIPFQVIDLSAEYKKRIVDYMFAEYEAGRTPNPDVLCNREIKFDVFLKHALALGADYVATGHYCQKAEETINGKTVYKLLCGADDNKDQSYFLCQVSQNQLAKALFPIGHIEKPAVRALAEKYGLSTAAKKDSQGLCFIGKVKLPDFLQQQLKPKKGNVIEIPDSLDILHKIPENLDEKCRMYPLKSTDGKVIGTHNGAHFYTIGQRKGLGIGGTTEPLFVVKIDTTENIVYVGKSEQHPALSRTGLAIKNTDVHWLREDMKLAPNQEANYDVRIRYRQKTVPAKLIQTAEKLYIVFEEPVKGIAPGQFAVWYKNNELIGSGVIE